MRGTPRSISPPRRLVIDLMRASTGVPFVSLKRTLNMRSLAEARAASGASIGWAALFAKAFCLVARDEPVLRTLYLRWPWERFYELPRSVGMVAVARHAFGEDCILPQHVGSADELPLAEVDRLIRHAKHAQIGEVRSFRKILRATALPWPLRRLLWAFGLNVGRQRANYFGSFGITSVSAFGPGELHAISPGPYVLTYGELKPDQTMEVVLRWDHRLTDAGKISNVISRLETVLNIHLATELKPERNLAPIRPLAAATG